MNSDAFLERLPNLALAMGAIVLEADRLALEAGRNLTLPRESRSVPGDPQHYADQIRPSLWHDLFVSSVVAEEYDVHVVRLDRARRHHYTCDMTHLFSISWRKGAPSIPAPLAYGLQVPARLAPTTGNQEPKLIPAQPWHPLTIQLTPEPPTPKHPLITIHIANKEDPRRLITLTRKEVEDSPTPITMKRGTSPASSDYPYHPVITLTPSAEPTYAQPYLFGA